MHNPSSTLHADRAPGAAPTAGVPRALWIGIAAVAVTAAGIASALAFRGAPAEVPPVTTTAAVAPATTTTPPAPDGATAQGTARVAPREPAPVIDEPVERPAPKPARAATSTHRAAPATPVEPAPEPVRAAAVCATCGVIESVQAVKQEGEGTGLGAVAGGVLGGVVGHQFGGGGGKKAMTVLGAIGGGVAGHQAEKTVRSTTVYSVRVRMDDGTVRTLTQSQAPAVGARVQVEGSTLRGV